MRRDAARTPPGPGPRQHPVLPRRPVPGGGRRARTCSCAVAGRDDTDPTDRPARLRRAADRRRRSASCSTSSSASSATARGTPSPAAPTTYLISGGVYRFVRHPMYAATAAIILGEALFFSQPILFARRGRLRGHDGVAGALRRGAAARPPVRRLLRGLPAGRAGLDPAPRRPLGRGGDRRLEEADDVAEAPVGARPSRSRGRSPRRRRRPGLQVPDEPDVVADRRPGPPARTNRRPGNCCWAAPIMASISSAAGARHHGVDVGRVVGEGQRDQRAAALRHALVPGGEVVCRRSSVMEGVLVMDHDPAAVAAPGR